MAVRRRVTGVARNEGLLLLRLLARDWHWEGGSWLVLVVVGRHDDEGWHTCEDCGIVVQGRVQWQLVKSLDQVRRKEEEERRPTPSEQPQFIPLAMSIHADEA